MNKNELKGLSPNSKKLRQYKESLVKLVLAGEHRTDSGLETIISLRNKLNN